MYVAREFMEALFKAKAEHRKRRAALPIEEKVRILVRLQKTRAAILRTRGLTGRVWQIDDPAD